MLVGKAKLLYDARKAKYAELANSNATLLPNLLKVKGTFGFEGSSIRDIRNLKLINGYQIKLE